MSLLFARLFGLFLAFISLGAGESEGDDPPPSETGSAPGEGGDPPLADEPPGDDDDDDLAALGEHVEEANGKDGKDASARKREIEEIAEATARRVGAKPDAPAPNFEAQIREREEVEFDSLRQAGATEAQLRDKRWEIDTNRTLRRSEAKSTAALFRAEELNDKSEFRELAADPKQSAIYRAYKDKVERELTELRNKGTNVPRSTLMYYLYGRDLAQGKLKKKSSAPQPKKTDEDALPANVRRIDRGRTPLTGARGDVRGGGGSTRKQDLEKRLAGKPI